MSYYLLLQFSISSIFFISFDKKFENNLKIFFYFLFVIFLIFFTGLRYEVGGDWIIYNQNFIANSKNFNIFKLNIKNRGKKLVKKL